MPVAKDYTVIGTIPIGQVGLSIKLEAATDLDINIYDYSGGTKGKRLVGYCNTPGCDMGTLSDSSAGTMTYAGMTISYSGYNGIDFKFGHESITVTGATTVPILMEAYAYEPGVVAVTYAWSATETACCLKTAACVNSFEKTISQGNVAVLGDIPAGVKDLYIELSTTVHIDTDTHAQIHMHRCIHMHTRTHKRTHI
jgi:hypothetical protein